MENEQKFIKQYTKVFLGRGQHREEEMDEGKV